MKNFLRGLAAGIAIGYLTAPRSGKETREQLSDTMNGMKDQWDEAKTQITGLIEDVKSQVGISTNELADKAQDKFDQYKHEANQTKEFVRNRYNDKVDDLADATKAGVDTAEENLKI
ncbi:YtxH domain-containing protein [Salmonirosea aquatica]